MTTPEAFMTDGPLPDISVAGDGVLLRPFQDDDLPTVKEASTDPAIVSITTVPEDYTDAAGLAFIERNIGRRVERAGWSLAIVETEAEQTAAALGQVGLWVPDLRQGRAHLGYWIVPSARRRGLAGRALNLISTWAFENLDLHRLTLYIEPWNIGSQKTAERAGFVQEALLKSWEVIDGESKDLYSYARFK